jgi:hypothetical protein
MDKGITHSPTTLFSRRIISIGLTHTQNSEVEVYLRTDTQSKIIKDPV